MVDIVILCVHCAFFVSLWLSVLAKAQRRQVCDRMLKLNLSMASELNHSNRLVDHLYRHEAGKLVAVLTRVFGTDSIKLAEDVTHDSLIEAIKDWPYKGLPTDPSSWLYKVAKNKTLNILNKEKYKKKYSSELSLNSYYTWASEPSKDHSFSANLIRDDQLRMIFTICHPTLNTK